MNKLTIGRTLFENYTEPLLINDCLDWELLQWDIDHWNNILGDEELVFRKGDICSGVEPQWERTTETQKGTFKDFINFSESNKKWLYFDYKYLKQWFTNKEEIRNVVNWKNFGFPERTAKDSTIWIGSKHAHTPCHIDTYGFNLVAQIFGTKLWILFPPEENLKRTRIPFEESSIYSMINFYSPGVQDCRSTSNCRKVVLHPGQVLFIPNGWWHYVENLETAISINTWIPLPEDDDKRIEEAIALTMIKALTNDIDEDSKKVILNPNEILEDFNLSSCIDLINHTRQQLKIKKQSSKKRISNLKTPIKKQHDFLGNKKDYAVPIEKLRNDEFKDFMKTQADRHAFSKSTEPRETKFDMFLKVITDPDVLQLIKQKLLDQTS